MTLRSWTKVLEFCSYLNGLCRTPLLNLGMDPDPALGPLLASSVH